MSTKMLPQTPVKVRVTESGPFFWHKDFIGQVFPVISMCFTETGLYFYVDRGERRDGAMSNLPFGIAERYCDITEWKDKEVVIHEERSGL